MRWWRALWLIGVIVGVALGCDDDPEPDADADADADGDGDGDGDGDADGDADADVDGDADADETGCEEFAEWERGDDGAADLTVPPAAGGAVAGRITDESQLLGGLKPKGQVGDILLANGQIALVIEDARASDGYNTVGGEILDVDLVGPEGPRDLSLFSEMFIGILPEVVTPEEVAVLADGSDGEAAIVRVTGELGPVWLLEAVGQDLFTRFLGLPITLDYILEPEAEVVAMRLTIRNDTTIREAPMGFFNVLVGGDGLIRYAPTVGFDEEASFGTQSYVALVGEEISYAFSPATGGVQYMFSYSGVHIYNSPSPLLSSCEETVVDLGVLAVAGGDVSQVEATLRRHRGAEPWPAIIGVVTDGAGVPVPEARVHVTSAVDGSYLSMGRTGADGSYRVELPAGEVVLEAWADGRRPSAPLTVTHAADGSTADLSLGDSGTIAWVVRDSDGDEIPAKVSLVPLDDPAPTAPSTFGEATHPNGAMIHDFSLPGRTSHEVAVGHYRLVASRGYEYEIDEVDVEVTAGETIEVELTLDHTVDTTGWLCGDFHIHTMYSPDSNDLLEWKVRASAAVGLELPISTDHRFISDLQPTVEALGLTEWVHWFPGHEITTFTYGHFNAYPLEVQPDEPNQGAIEWLGLSPGELFDRVREEPIDPVLQINHPRGSRSAGAYFDWVGLDPFTLETEVPEGWSTNFDSVEVFNGSGWSSNRDATVRDWFGFLENDHLITAIGNSDSHDAEWSDVGYPRTCLVLPDESPATVTRSAIRDVVLSGRVVIDGGIFVMVEAEDGRGPGDVVPAPDGTSTVHITVQAPTWVDGTTVEVVVNGEVVETITMDESTEDPLNPVVRLDRDFEVLLDDDGWLVVGAYAEGSRLVPVTPRREPFGATNALYFDVDDDGFFRDSDRAVTP